MSRRPRLPLFVRLARVVVFGSGMVARRKLAAVGPCARSVTVVSAGRAIRGVRFVRARLSPDAEVPELEPRPDLVIAALDDRELNRAIARECRRRRIAVNVVDDPAVSDVLFCAVAREGDVTIAVSTGGASPVLAARLRDEVAPVALRGGTVAPLLRRLRRQLRGRGPAERLTTAVLDDPSFREAMAAGDVRHARAAMRRILLSCGTDA